MAKKKTVQPDESSTVPAPPPRRRTARRPAAAPPPEVSAGDGSPAHEPLVAADDTNAPAQYAPTYDEIAEAAYHRYLERGGDHGQDFDDWLEAERALKRRRL
jgi:hypothetical protein